MFKFFGRKPPEDPSPEAGAEVIPLPQGLERARAVLKKEGTAEVIPAFRKDPQRFRYLLDNVEFVTMLYTNHSLFTDNELRNLSRWIIERAARLDDIALANRLTGLARHIENQSNQEERQRGEFDIIKDDELKKAMKEDGLAT